MVNSDCKMKADVYCEDGIIKYAIACRLTSRPSVIAPPPMTGCLLARLVCTGIIKIQLIITAIILT